MYFSKTCKPQTNIFQHSLLVQNYENSNNGEKTASLINVAGKTGCLPAEN
jgi:hypothetical protein